MSAAVVDHLWQSTLIASLAWMLTLALRDNSARARYWIWFAASLKFLLPFSLLATVGSYMAVWVPAHVASRPDVLLHAAQSYVQPFAAIQSSSWIASAAVPETSWVVFVLIGLWSLGALFVASGWLTAWLQVRRVIRTAAPLAFDLPVPVRSSAELSEPAVAGILRQVLLLPEGIAERLSQAQLRAILAHELCHVRRHDNFLAAVHTLVQALFWFHPLVWLIGRRLMVERELACDEAVLEEGNAREVYAEGILQVCRHYFESAQPCVAGVMGADLTKRVRAIMCDSNPRQLNVLKRALLGTTVGCAIVAPLASGMTMGSAMRDFILAQELQGFDIRPASGEGQGVSLNAGHLAIRNMSLKELISVAYGVRERFIYGGPDWLGYSRFDIDADVGDEAAVDLSGGLAAQTVLRTLLEEELELNIQVRSNE